MFGSLHRNGRRNELQTRNDCESKSAAKFRENIANGTKILTGFDCIEGKREREGDVCVL